MGKKARFIKKKKEELTKEDLKAMVRKPTYTKNIPVSSMLKYYGFQNVSEYIDFLRSKGLKLSSQERLVLRETKNYESGIDKNIRSNRTENTSSKVRKSFLRAKDLKFMRMFRDLTIEETAKIMDVPSPFLEYWEETDPVRDDVAGYYMESLNISNSVASQIVDYNDGKTSKIQEDRKITDRLKDAVRKRDNNRCTNCGSSKKLHFHHIKRFSEGGQHKLDNLKILCVSCHAEEHKGESGYRMLKHMAKE